MGLTIPTGQKQTSWLFTSMVEDLNTGIPTTNPASLQGGASTQGLQISSPEHWIALSTRYKVTIQQISIGETNCTIHWIEIYPVDSTIQPLNNQCQGSNCLATLPPILPKLQANRAVKHSSKGINTQIINSNLRGTWNKTMPQVAFNA